MAGNFIIEIFTKDKMIVEKPKIIIIPKNGDVRKFESKNTSDNVLKWYSIIGNIRMFALKDIIKIYFIFIFNL